MLEQITFINSQDDVAMLLLNFTHPLTAPKGEQIRTYGAFLGSNSPYYQVAEVMNLQERHNAARERQRRQLPV